MTFFWPHILWLLAFPAVLGAAGWARGAARGAAPHPRIPKGEAGLGNAGLLPEKGAAGGGRRGGTRPWLCTGIALAIVALARPQWGRTRETTVSQARDIILALDLSRSMLTPDVKPSRLDRSKLLVQSLLDRLQGERVGLIVFSGTAFLQSPLSADYGILRDFLPALGPGYMPEGGTNYRELLDTAIEAFGKEAGADRTLIILSDGEATDDNWHERIPDLTRLKIHVIGLGVGTAAGGLMPDGQGGYIKDDSGAVVVSHLEPRTLQELASATGGVYRDGSQWVDLAALVATTVGRGRSTAATEQREVRGADRFQWFLAPAFLCLILSFWLELPADPAARDLRLPPPIAALTLLLGLLLVPADARALSLANGAPGAAGGNAPSDPAADLSRITGRLSGGGPTGARDWADFARTTLEWGDRLKSSGEKIPAGPVNDGLAAVDEGERADPAAADWPSMRGRLGEFLRKPPEPPPQKKPQPQSGKDPQGKDPNAQDKPKDGKSGQDQSGRNGGTNQSQEAKKQPQASSRPQRPDPDSSPPHEGTQTVGGVRQAGPSSAELHNPDLALPLEKLEELRNQDSPAELYRLFRKDEPAPPPTKGKDW